MSLFPKYHSKLVSEKKTLYIQMKITVNKRIWVLRALALSRAGKGRGLRGTCNEVSSREKPRSLEVSLRNGVGNFFNVKKVAPLKFGVQGFSLEKSFSVKTIYNNDSQRL